MKLRIGLIGQGDAWQTRHRPALRVLHDRFDVRAVFSTVAKLAENTAAEFQADVVDGYRALVNRCDIDAVIVLQKNWLGWLPVLAACEAGKAVYWAGDLDFDPLRDAEVRSAVDESGVAFMVEFPRRFAPATLRLKELIATRLGAPKLMFCHRRLQATPANAMTNGVGNGVAGKPDSNVDPSRRELVELIDWCRYVVGCEPTTVSSVAHQSGGQTDYRCMSLAFPAHGDAPAVTAQVSCGSYIHSTWHEAAGFRPPSAMQISCQRGVAFLDLPSTLVWFDDAGRNMETLDTESPVGEKLLAQFHRSVTSLLRNMGDLNDAYQAVAIFEAAKQSEAEGRRIDLC
ncbi:Gfo/Idh/MocA family protein [Rubripirellula lacrimiformis]|nr:Gfo/Idh/MocA family oxidoreductase [Rubripirellula lacrimiformis]